MDNAGKKDESRIVGSVFKKLLMASIVIILCLSLIIGITFALFTNNIDDGKIGINVTSGKIKVDIVDKDQQSLVGDVLQFVRPDTDEPLYFEPGALYYTEGFSIKNIGSVPVNLKFFISNDPKMDMEAFEDAFEFYITTDPTNVDSKVGLAAYKDGLAPGDSTDFYYLVVKMKESAGNVFSNREYGGIGITVHSIQSNVSIEEYDGNE